MESSASQRCKGASTGSADKVDGVRRALKSDHARWNFYALNFYTLIWICEIDFSSSPNMELDFEEI